MQPRKAWEEAGQPGGEGGLCNIRKRVRLANTKAAAAAEAEAEPEPQAEPTRKPCKTRKDGRAAEDFRFSSTQVDKMHAASEMRRRKYVDALKAASSEYEERQTKGEQIWGLGQKIAKAINATLPSDVKELTSQGPSHPPPGGDWARWALAAKNGSAVCRTDTGGRTCCDKCIHVADQWKRAEAQGNHA
jgi:hypothetical protein